MEHVKHVVATCDLSGVGIKQAAAEALRTLTPLSAVLNETYHEVLVAQVSGDKAEADVLEEYMQTLAAARREIADAVRALTVVAKCATQADAVMTRLRETAHG